MGIMRKFHQLITAGASALIMITPAMAGTGDPFIPSWDAWLSVNSSGDLIDEPSTDNNGENDFSFSGADSTSQYAIDWNLTVNPDPFIDGAITITNLSSSAQNFTVKLSLPVTPAFSPGLVGGSIDATIYDLNSNGATLKPQGGDSNPIYFGRINGASVLTMFAQNLNCPSAGCITNSGESQMPPTVPFAGVTNNIGTWLVFNLSGGDKVTFNTHFEVLPVPVPASAWLMGSAILGLVSARRRHK